MCTTHCKMSFRLSVPVPSCFCNWGRKLWNKISSVCSPHLPHSIVLIQGNLYLIYSLYCGQKGYRSSRHFHYLNRFKLHVVLSGHQADDHVLSYCYHTTVYFGIRNVYTDTSLAFRLTVNTNSVQIKILHLKENPWLKQIVAAIYIL